VDTVLFERIACDLEDILSDVIEKAICGCGVEDVCARKLSAAAVLRTFAWMFMVV